MGQAPDICRVGGPISSAQRNRLPDRAFGLPRERKYPIHDLSHARNAKARAAQQFNAGNLTRAQFLEITRRADRVIEVCESNPHGGRMPNPSSNPHNPMSPATKTALWIGGAVLGVAAVGGVVYLATRKKDDAAPPESLKPKPPGATPKPPVPPIPKPTPTPVPALPPTEPPIVEPDEPVSTAEPTGPADATPLGVTTAAHGVAVDAADRSMVVLNPDAWVAWAGPEVAGLNVEEWSAGQVMDNVFHKAFPMLGPNLSQQPGWTINGQPYEQVVERGQDLIDGLVSGDLTVPRNFPGHRAFAKIMAGQVYTPLRLTVEPPNNPETGWELYQREKPGFGLHHYLVRFTKTTHPALGQAHFSWTWWVWGPGVTTLGESNAMKKGGKSQKKASIEAAQEFIDSYAIAVAQVAEAD